MAGSIHIEAVILSGPRLGRDFVSVDSHGEERFSARLMESSRTLEIIWAESIALLLLSLREIQLLAGGPGSFTRVAGMASDKLEANLRAEKRVDVARISRLLGRILGGEWKLEVTRRPGKIPAIFDLRAFQVEV